MVVIKSWGSAENKSVEQDTNLTDRDMKISPSNLPNPVFRFQILLVGGIIRPLIDIRA